MKHVTTIVFLLTLLGVSGCGDDEPGAPRVAKATGAIYAAALLATRDDWAGTGGEAATIVLARTNEVELQTFDAGVVPSDLFPSDGKLTRADRIRESVFGAFPALRRDTWDSYAAANAVSRDLSQIVDVPWRVAFIEAEELTDLFQGKPVQEGFNTLFKRYPGAEALLRMSVPGISKDGAQALLYFSEASGDLDASGHYLLLVRQDGTWKVAQRTMVWIS